MLLFRQSVKIHKNYSKFMGLTMAPKADFPEAYKLCKSFELTQEQMEEVVVRMTKEIKMGLQKETQSRAVIKCWVTYVTDLPTGKERGKFLALDMGGTNFRVLLVNLKSDTDVETISKAYVMNKALMTGEGTALFDFVAECLAEFTKEHSVSNSNLPLGFTFSFPVQQIGLANGILVAWTKGFNCSDVVGKDVVEMLQEAIQRRGDVKIKIVAILNDTTGTLMSSAFKHRNCRIGLIVGTGSNACYVEKMANAETYEKYQSSQKPFMIINAEWGAFGDNGVLDFVRTPFDKVIDKQTHNVGRQTFEKCISGMYLGEMVRLILIELMKGRHIFQESHSQTIQEQWSFQTKYISEIESDPPGSYRNVSIVLDQLGIRHAQDKDKACLRYICESVSTRSAKLVACGLACMINHMNNNDISIGVDGSVYRYHPKYHALLMENLKLLVKPNIRFELNLSEDGSGRGAALIAAVAEYKNPKN